MRLATILFLCLFLNIARADEIDQLMNSLNAKLADPHLYKAALSTGEERATFCFYCHGADGNSLRDYIPNLAQQSPRYLLQQFEHFRLGIRKEYVMNNIAKNLTPEDRVNIALYFAAQKVKPHSLSVGAGMLAHGNKYYINACIPCHGEKGYGKHNLPRIAGQSESYVKHTLRNYRAKSSRRPDSTMQAISEKLSDRDIDALAAYLSSMP